MRRFFGPLIALGLVACAACGGDEEPAPPPGRVASTPEIPLAAQAVLEAGGDLSAIGGLAFTFVVDAGSERVFSAQHSYDLRGARDRVRWTSRDGKVFDALVDLSTRTACGTVDGAVATGAELESLAQDAYARWVNDAYWLLMPHKLRDPGARLTVQDPQDRDGVRYDVLRLEFESVGLTPGDVYFLFIDPTTHRIARWEMQLEGQEGPPTGVSWTDYRAVGPVTLPHDHVTDDGARHIRFEGVAELGHESDAFDVAGCE